MNSIESILGMIATEAFEEEPEPRRARRPRLVECICAGRNEGARVVNGRWVSKYIHQLMCPVTAEQGTTDEETDEGEYFPDE